jgi:hypothetical protein
LSRLHRGYKPIAAAASAHTVSTSNIKRLVSPGSVQITFPEFLSIAEQVADLRAAVLEFEPVSPLGQRYAAEESPAPTNRSRAAELNRSRSVC